MTRGFITLAVGRDSYYELAHNLLMSYRKTNSSNFPWTLVCDRENQWTAEFDNIIKLENPTKSYMDKLTLFGLVPYDECIFIDADCLIFNDLDTLWERMSYVDGFSCFGRSLSMDSKDGWFLLDDIGEWKNQISFIPQMHGGICFLKRGEKLNRILQLAQQIETTYSDYKFKYFDKPADEPILALASAVVGSHPIPAQDGDFIFLPSASKNEQRKIVLSNSEYCASGRNAYAIRIIHFQNHNTEKAVYKVSKDVVVLGRKNAIQLRYVYYSIIDRIRYYNNRVKRLWMKIIK